MRKHRPGEGVSASTVAVVAQMHEPHPRVEWAARRVDLAGTIVIVASMIALAIITTNTIPYVNRAAVARIEGAVTWIVGVSFVALVVTALLEFAMWKSTEKQRDANTAAAVVDASQAADRAQRLEELVDVSEALVAVNEDRFNRANTVVLCAGAAMLLLEFAWWHHLVPRFSYLACATGCVVISLAMQYRYRRRRAFYLDVRGEAARALTARRRVDERDGRRLLCP